MFIAKFYNRLEEEVLTLTGNHYPLLRSYSQTLCHFHRELDYIVTYDTRYKEPLETIIPD